MLFGELSLRSPVEGSEWARSSGFRRKPIPPLRDQDAKAKRPRLKNIFVGTKLWHLINCCMVSDVKIALWFPKMKIQRDSSWDFHWNVKSKTSYVKDKPQWSADWGSCCTLLLPSSGEWLMVWVIVRGVSGRRPEVGVLLLEHLLERCMVSETSNSRSPDIGQKKSFSRRILLFQTKQMLLQLL